MKQRTLRAIDALINGWTCSDYEISHTGDHTITVIVRDGFNHTWEVHKLESGRWIAASWFDRNNQWRSSDFSAAFSKANRGASYCYARSLETLAGDIKTYRSPVAAIRAQLP